MLDTLFNHILVPVDFSEKNATAFEIAKQIALQNAARVSLLHVIEVLDLSDDDEVSEFYEKMRQRSDRQLQALVPCLADENLDVEYATLVGNRSREIATYAEQNAVDLIVMGSHPIEPDLPNRGWSTISYQVSALCRCSILMVKQPWTISKSD